MFCLEVGPNCKVAVSFSSRFFLLATIEEQKALVGIAELFLLSYDSSYGPIVAYRCKMYHNETVTLEYIFC